MSTRFAGSEQALKVTIVKEQHIGPGSTTSYFSTEKINLVLPIFQQLFVPYDATYISAKYPYVDGDGRRYGLWDMTGPGGAAKGNPRYEVLGITRYWRYSEERMQRLLAEGRVIQPRLGAVPRLKRYLDEMPGIAIGDMWDDISPINSQAKERLGYPTQKPQALLERIIGASSNEGDSILDPFCGCGTTINVAERLHRKWIGIDITHLAIALIKNRLHDTFGPELSPYEVIGDPKDLASAQALAEYDRYQFQWWAVGLVNARPAQDKKKGADSGIDGYIYFEDDDSGKAKQIIVQVKSGKVSVPQVRDLKGVLEREKAVIGIFVSLEPFTDPMRKEAISAGYYDPEYLAPEHKASRIQLFTVQDLLSGAEPKYPRLLLSTFKRAKRQYKEKVPEQRELL